MVVTEGDGAVVGATAGATPGVATVVPTSIVVGGSVGTSEVEVDGTVVVEAVEATAVDVVASSEVSGVDVARVVGLISGRDRSDLAASEPVRPTAVRRPCHPPPGQRSPHLPWHAARGGLGAAAGAALRV